MRHHHFIALVDLDLGYQIAERVVVISMLYASQESAERAIARMREHHRVIRAWTENPLDEDCDRC